MRNRYLQVSTQLVIKRQLGTGTNVRILIGKEVGHVLALHEVDSRSSNGSESVSIGSRIVILLSGENDGRGEEADGSEAEESYGRLEVGCIGLGRILCLFGGGGWRAHADEG